MRKDSNIELVETTFISNSQDEIHHGLAIEIVIQQEIVHKLLVEAASNTHNLSFLL